MKSLYVLIISLSAASLVVLVSNYFIPSQRTIKKKVRHASKREEWLTQARVSLTAQQFWIAVATLGTIGFLLTYALSKILLLSVVFGLAICIIPFVFISKKRTAISKELMNAWPDALRDISATLSAGHTLSFALHTLGTVGPEAIAPHMKRFTMLEKSLGYVPAIEIVREEMNDATTDRIIEVLIVAHERGGKAVAEIIDDLIDATTQDIALAETIATESLEMKINSRAVVILPWCVLLLLTLGGGIFREYYQSRAGSFVIAVGLVLSCAGIAILSRLTRVEQEPRVFTPRNAQ